MHIKDIIHTSLRALITHKGRSLLTVLGIVIGIGSIMIVMSIGDSATRMIVKEIQSFGSENVFINPGKPSDGLFSFSGQSAAILLKSLTEKDVESLRNKANVPDAITVNPAVNGSMNVSYDSETKTVSIIGSGSAGFDIYNISVSSGRIFTDADVDSKAAVAVIGKNVVDDLFGSKYINPVGEKIKIKDKKFKVIGVLSTLGSSMFGIDDVILIPYSSMQQYLLGIRHFHEIAVEARTADAVPEMIKDIEITLRENHDIDDPEDDDFIISTQEDIMESVKSILNAITVFLAFVAAISLLVGGIGVMNIMLVSVTERTKEIGLRKALGATNKDILTQFLLEAAFLSFLGGVIGVVCGSAITFIGVLAASYATGMHFPFVFSILGACLGIIVSCGTGIVFGIFPARNAARKSPIEALRDE